MQNVNMVANGKRNSRLNPDDELDVGCTSLNFVCVCVGGGVYKSRRLPEITVLPTESG